MHGFAIRQQHDTQHAVLGSGNLRPALDAAVGLNLFTLRMPYHVFNPLQFNASAVEALACSVKVPGRLQFLKTTSMPLPAAIFDLLREITWANINFPCARNRVIPTSILAESMDPGFRRDDICGRGATCGFQVVASVLEPGINPLLR